MAEWKKLHNMRAIKRIAEEIEFHSGLAIAAANRILGAEDRSSDWPNLYLLASHAGCVGAFIEPSMMRGKALKTEFPGRSKAIRAFSGIDEDLSGIKRVRDAMIHADERLEAEWIRLEALAQITTELEMRAVGPLPADGHALVNWDPERRELSARPAPDRNDNTLVEYHTVNVVELRDALRNIEFGVSRISGILAGLTEGGNPFPPRVVITHSEDPR